MRNDQTFSRRVVIAGFAAIPTLSATTAVADADMALIALGRKLNAASQALDQAGSSEWPNAATTGVPAGTKLTTVNGNFTSSSNGQIIDGLNVSGTIIINNAGVTVQNCHAGLIVIAAPNVTIQDCTVVGINGSATSESGIVIASPAQLGGSGSGTADGATILRCNISGVENGIWLEGNGALIQDNYIHDLHAPPTGHIDGLQVPNDFPGVANATIRHNNFDQGLGTESSCIQIDNGHNFIIDNNRFYGGSYELYLLSRESGTTQNCLIINNLFVANRFGGAIDEQPFTGLNFYRGNVDENGKPVLPNA